MTRFGLCLGLLGFGATYANAQWTATILPADNYNFHTPANGIGSSGVVGSGTSYNNVENPHALLWKDQSQNPTNLHPANFYSSKAVAVVGNNQFGSGEVSFGQYYRSHALVWHGSAESFVDLNPTGYESTYCEGGSMNSQVGYGAKFGENKSHALLWRGSAESAIELDPEGSSTAGAFKATDDSQVGRVYYGEMDTAALWHGSRDSYVNLHPNWALRSGALAVWGNQQGGYTSLEYGIAHATIWNSSAESATVIHPSEYYSTGIRGMAGAFQVGGGRGPNTQGVTHALAWQGTAESCVDLHQFLPASYFWSYAYGVDENGDIVGFARDDQVNIERPVKWTRVVPEPGTFIAIGTGLLILFGTRRKA